MTGECMAWIRRACEAIKYGEVIITIHNGRVTKVETKEKKVIVK
jgi:hypothetical protein